MANINGTNGNDRITGTNRADRILGDAGNDTVYGNSGFDTLFGQTGNDLIFGGYGNDLLYGGAGSDILSGGFGRDNFVFSTRPAGDGFAEIDTIVDFTPEDQISIDNNLFPALGNQQRFLSSAEFKVVGNGGTVDANDRIIYNISTGVLSYDFNGSGSGGRIALADLVDNPTVMAGDIFIF